MAVKNNHVGEIAGIYEIVELMPYKANDGHALYRGICCQCGAERITKYSDLKVITKCTHLRLNGEITSNLTYWDNRRIKSIFDGMKQRCYNQNDKSYKWYGAKGIKIYDEWLNSPKMFEEWALNNGYSDDLTIDRIDENCDYCPDNCRWVSDKDNAKYKSTTSLIEVNGEIYTGRDWSEILGFGINTINEYIRKYGLENTKEFIQRCIDDPGLKLQRSHSQSYYDLYMGH